eukprot:3374510-Prymnesium_polylepis.1
MSKRKLSSGGDGHAVRWSGGDRAAIQSVRAAVADIEELGGGLSFVDTDAPILTQLRVAADKQAA